MKDKLISGCFSVAIVIIFIVMLLSAISMIKNGAYIKGGFFIVCGITSCYSCIDRFVFKIKEKRR